MKVKVKITKQYGIVNKLVLQNKNITANAKGLYVYLCARSGNKGNCNPTIPTICKDLNINQTTFHKLKRELIENKVIKIEKTETGLKKRNNYILLQETKKGYGIVYLDIVKDQNIPLKAKAIYGLLSFISGIRFIAYPTAKLLYSLLNISRNTYFKAINLLKRYNYVKTKQLHINSRFAYCNYYINGAEPNKKDTRYIFKRKYYNKNNTPSTKNNREKEKPSPEYFCKEEIIKEKIEYETILDFYINSKKAQYILDNIVSILVSNIYSESPSKLKIDGLVRDGNVVKMVFNKLNYNNI